MTKITPVILSGGSGTRLWPVSRTGRPKQMLSLTHERTMLQLTALRACGDGRFEAPIVVANEAHADEIVAQLSLVGCSPSTLILEPSARNTAPAIAAAAMAAPADAVLLVMPSDQVVADVDAFAAAIDAAMPMVREGWLATFGITPDAPETGYGYILAGQGIAEGVHRVERFVEKPDRATAEGYLADGRYVWNGGIFMFRADAFLSALQASAPDIALDTRTSMDGAATDGIRLRPDAAAFGAIRSESVDYAVMERSDRVAVVPVEMGWSDVGSWDALHAIAAKDEAGNVHHGEVVSLGSSGCLIRSHGPLVAAVGVEDLIIVSTPDAILVMRRGSSQDVKLAVEALKKDGHRTLDVPFS